MGKKRSKRANIRQKGGGLVTQKLKELCQSVGLQAYDMKNRPFQEICNLLNVGLKKTPNGNGGPIKIQKIIPGSTKPGSTKKKGKKFIYVQYICNGKEGRLTLYQRELVSLL